MSIELLWIIPIVAAALLVLMLALSLQQNEKDQGEDTDISDLNREVVEYNRGVTIDKKVLSDTAETRLGEIEGTIKLVSTALSNQQKIIENFQGKDVKLEHELNDLKKKLKELQHEYDITISENYSLRAYLKKIKKGSGDIADSSLQPSFQNDFSQNISDTVRNNKVLNVEIFDDTRLIDPSKPSYLDDTAEINLSELNK